MQPETQYFKAVPVSEKPKQPDLYHTLIENESLGIEGLPCHNNYIGTSNGGYWEIDGDSKVTHYLQPTIIPDAAVLRDLEITFKEFDAYFNHFSKIEPKDDRHKDAGHTWIAFSDKWEAFKKDIFAREALSAGDGWVRVDSGKLPEVNTRCWLGWENENDVWEGYYDGHLFVDNEGLEIKNKPTHYMIHSIPSPPIK